MLTRWFLCYGSEYIFKYIYTLNLIFIFHHSKVVYSQIFSIQVLIFSWWIMRMYWKCCDNENDCYLSPIYNSCGIFCVFNLIQLLCDVVRCSFLVTSLTFVTFPLLISSKENWTVALLTIFFFFLFTRKIFFCAMALPLWVTHH